MDSDASDVVRMGLECLDLLHGIVVVDPNEHIIRSCNYPLLSCDEFGSTHWQISYFEGFHQALLKMSGDELKARKLRGRNSLDWCSSKCKHFHCTSWTESKVL